MSSIPSVAEEKEKNVEPDSPLSIRRPLSSRIKSVVPTSAPLPPAASPITPASPDSSTNTVLASPTVQEKRYSTAGSVVSRHGSISSLSFRMPSDPQLPKGEPKGKAGRIRDSSPPPERYVCTYIIIVSSRTAGAVHPMQSPRCYFPPCHPTGNTVKRHHEISWLWVHPVPNREKPLQVGRIMPRFGAIGGLRLHRCRLQVRAELRPCSSRTYMACLQAISSHLVLPWKRGPPPCKSKIQRDCGRNPNFVDIAVLARGSG